MSWVLHPTAVRERNLTFLPVGRRVLVALVALVVLSTVGIMLIEGWTLQEGVWHVVITLSTVGYGEVRPMTWPGRWFTIAFVVAGLGVATQAASEVARYVADVGLAGALLERRRLQELQSMRNHFVVVGFGRLGREIAAEIRHAGGEVLVVDQREPEEVPPGTRLLVGDATLDETLRDAGIERARGLAIATPSDAVNVYITLSARQQAPDLFIHTRVEDEGAALKARRAGADRVLMPYHLGGTRMAQAMLRPSSSDFVEHATQRQFDDILMEDVVVTPGSPVHGRLRELELPARHGVFVVAIQPSGQDRLETPGPSVSIEPGDRLVVVGKPDDVQRFVDTCRRST